MLLLSGCSIHTLTGKMPVSHLSMAQTYQQAISSETDHATDNTLSAIRTQIRPCYSDMRSQNMNRADWSFHRLPNPDIIMYVLPHWVNQGDTELAVPGYRTHFPLYSQIHYVASASMLKLDNNP